MLKLRSVGTRLTSGLWRRLWALVRFEHQVHRSSHDKFSCSMVRSRPPRVARYVVLQCRFARTYFGWRRLAGVPRGGPNIEARTGRSAQRGKFQWRRADGLSAKESAVHDRTARTCLRMDGRGDRRGRGRDRKSCAGGESSAEGESAGGAAIAGGRERQLPGNENSASTAGSTSPAQATARLAYPSVRSSTSAPISSTLPMPRRAMPSGWARRRA